ncbi:MAG: right-handed parallel beta-helix repeat-containing protein [Planctomycetota bacterium]|jgi:hypothetical protein
MRGPLRFPFCFPLLLLLAAPAFAVEHDVGPGRTYTELDTVPWHTLAPGDTVTIYWRSVPYRTKFVLCVVGTSAQPITVRGVVDANGARPVISGDGALTPFPLNYWNEDRGVIKIGGANTPADTMPAYIVVENLDVRSARPAYSYTGDDSASHTYASNAAAIYVEKGINLTIRNCVLQDCGNGFFCAWQGSNVLVERCTILNNGIAASIFEHNNYTEANGITFQFNRFGPLRAGCLGNNLKDRSAGCVIRYNWIEGGNRQLDLVDSGNLNGDAKYGTTHVYGNVLVEPDGAGNSQIVHYGGDSGNLLQYRKGTLFFYNNTVVSTRAGNTTLFRLSSVDESCDCRNNVFYVTATGDRLALMNSDGVLDLTHCWFKPGWVDTHGALNGTINDAGNHVTGSDPGFNDFPSQDFHLPGGSPCVDKGTSLHAAVASTHPLTWEYLEHAGSLARASDGNLDLGAFEFGSGVGPFDPGPILEGCSCGLLGLEALALLALLGLLRRRTTY